MNIILIAVASVDGKLTKWHQENIYTWSSSEDLAHFKHAKAAHKLLVMGSSTFEKVKDIPEAGLQPEEERLRIVLTRNPEKYASYAVDGELEFTSESPTELVSRLKKEGHTDMLLVGGSRIATSFFREKLVTELWLTVEPRIFGQGEPLVQAHQFDISLRLHTWTQLNKQGTLLLQYELLK